MYCWLSHLFSVDFIFRDKDCCHMRRYPEASFWFSLLRYRPDKNVLAAPKRLAVASLLAAGSPTASAANNRSEAPHTLVTCMPWRTWLSRDPASLNCIQMVMYGGYKVSSFNLALLRSFWRCSGPICNHNLRKKRICSNKSGFLLL